MLLSVTLIIFALADFASLAIKNESFSPGSHFIEKSIVGSWLDHCSYFVPISLSLVTKNNRTESKAFLLRSGLQLSRHSLGNFVYEWIQEWIFKVSNGESIKIGVLSMFVRRKDLFTASLSLNFHCRYSIYYFSHFVINHIQDL